jgi:hyperpolarization activated cyclic nucleotide-gated potassium channel 2
MVGLEFPTTLDSYVTSIYYAVTTITTIGYGDISPVSTTEKIFFLFMAFVACGNFGYVLNQIGCIIQENSKQQELYRNSQKELILYMQQRNVPKDL